MPEEIRAVVGFAVDAIEIAGATVIAVVVAVVLWTIMSSTLKAGRPPDKTSLAPSLQDVAVLAGIIILRTLLSLSIEYELRNLPTANAPSRIEERT